MKKYILNIISQRTKQSILVQELSMLIGLYNEEQPNSDFITWLTNNMSEDCFLFEVNRNGKGNITVFQFKHDNTILGTIESIVL